VIYKFVADVAPQAAAAPSNNLVTLPQAGGRRRR
jgi:hypothetical protein